MMLRTGSAILQGLRPNQEDARLVYSCPSGTLIAVADGLGGHDMGEVASATAVGALPAAIEAHGQDWDAVFGAVDEAVWEAGGNTTLSLAWLADGRVTFAWCGDSPCVLAGRPRKGLAVGWSAPLHGYGNWVERCLGRRSKRSDPETHSLPLHPGDWVFVCSDGLDPLLDDGASRKTFARLGKSPTEDLDALMGRLCQAAIDGGSRDNCTAVVAVVAR